MLEFEHYLEHKKIDPRAFKKACAGEYARLEKVFVEVSPNSFTQQKLFLINRLRRAHPLAPAEAEQTATKPSKSAKTGVRIPKPNPKKP